MSVLQFQSPVFLNALGADRIIDDQAGTMWVMQKDNSIKGDWKLQHNTLLPEGDTQITDNFTLPNATMTNDIVVKVGEEVLTKAALVETPDYNYININGNYGGGYIRDYGDGVFELYFGYNDVYYGEMMLSLDFGELPVENRNIWQIKRIQETIVSGKKIMTIQYPDGMTRFSFVAENYLSYTYKYSI